MPARTFPEHGRTQEFRIEGTAHWRSNGAESRYHRTLLLKDRQEALIVMQSLRSDPRLTWDDGPYLEQRTVIITAWLREDCLHEHTHAVEVGPGHAGGHVLHVCDTCGEEVG